MCGGEIMINSEDEEDMMPPLDDTSDVDLEFLVEGEALVTRCVSSAQVKEDTLSNNVKIFSILASMLIIRFFFLDK